MDLSEVSTDDLMEELLRRVDCGAVILARNQQIVVTDKQNSMTILSRYKGSYLETLGLCFAFQQHLAEGLVERVYGDDEGL